MVNINFYPWRVAENKYRKKFLKKMVVVVLVFSLAVVLVAHLVLSMRHEALQQQVQVLQEKMDEIKQVEVDRDSSSFSLPMSQLLAVLPQGKTCLGSVERSEKFFIVEGKAKSMFELNHFIFYLHDKLFSTVEIRKIEQDQNGMLIFRVAAR